MPCRTASPGIMISRGPDVDTHVGQHRHTRPMRRSTKTCSVGRERDEATWNTIGKRQGKSAGEREREKKWKGQQNQTYILVCREEKEQMNKRRRRKKKRKWKRGRERKGRERARDRFAYPVCLSRLSVHCRRHASCRADSSYLHSARENLYKRSWASDELDDWRAWRLLPCLTLPDCLPSYLVTTCHGGWHEGHGVRSYDA